MERTRASTVRRVTIAALLLAAVAVAVAPVFLLQPPAIDARTALVIVAAGDDDGITDAQLARANTAVRTTDETHVRDDGVDQQTLVARDGTGCWALTLLDGRAAGSPQQVDPQRCTTAGLPD